MYNEYEKHPGLNMQCKEKNKLRYIMCGKIICNREIVMSVLLLIILVISNKLPVYSQSDFRKIPYQSDVSVNNKYSLDSIVWSCAHEKNIYSKPPINFKTIDEWMQIGPDGALSISSNGHFLSYGVQHLQNPGVLDSLVIQSIEGSWRRAFSGTKPGVFSFESNVYVFNKKNNLCFLKLRENKVDIIGEVDLVKFSEERNAKWVVYRKNETNGFLVLKNLDSDEEVIFTNISQFAFTKTGTALVCMAKSDANEMIIYDLNFRREFRFRQVNNYFFDNTGSAFILHTKEKLKSDTINTLKYFRYTIDGTIEEDIIWSSRDSTTNVGSCSFDRNGSQVLFSVTSNDFTKLKRTEQYESTSIWFYKKGMNHALKILDKRTEGIGSNLEIVPAATFTDDSSVIQFSLQKPSTKRTLGSEGVNVDIWNYLDTFLQVTQSKKLKEALVYKGFYDIGKGKIIFLENDDEKIKLQSTNYAIISKSGSAVNGDRFWEKGYEQNVNWIFTLKDENREILPSKGGEYTFWFSPGGKYLVYFDAERNGNYFSFDLRSKQVRLVSKGLPPGLFVYENDYFKHQKTEPCGIAGWMNNDSAVLIYDNFDMWLLYLDGKKLPVNLTNGHGRFKKIQFSLNTIDRRRPGGKLVFTYSDTLLLKAFDRIKKQSGYYRKIISKSDNPELLYMENCFIIRRMHDQGGIMDPGLIPLKASGENVWIVKHQTATSSPNYYVTNNFRTFSALTKSEPHREINWLTSELVTFRVLNGKLSQGILYKPENFDPQKKYPVIISFYWYLSDGLNQFPAPDYMVG
jgi:hypothetical protein